MGVVTLFLMAVADGSSWFYRSTWGGIVLRAVTYLVVVTALVLAVWSVLPRLFPPRCPKCRGLLDKENKRVYEGEKRDQIILPPIDLITSRCPSCGHETRSLVADTGPTFFERGQKTRWPFGWSNSPEAARETARAVLEWDRTMERLKREFDAQDRRRA
ncbi:MAG: hypothetical protein C4551_00900 [Bacillota bacterium]|nr:MAG: hypothetical protein C4551_00900 [Bacillota bacterium]